MCAFTYMYIQCYDIVHVYCLQGEMFIEATQVFSPWVYQSVRIYKTLPFVEFEYTVGPIPNK